MDFDENRDETGREPHRWIKLIPLAVAVVFIVIILVVMALQKRMDEDSTDSLTGETRQNALGTEDGEAGETVGDEPIEARDPQETISQEQGSQVDVRQLLTSDRVREEERVTVGIDVSRYQGTIDWSQVAESGIDFAMIRVGYRSADKDRGIYADSNARYNMQEAQAAGIQVGVYFFSTAASEEEAREEAMWVAEYIAQYRITYPVAFDCEGYEQTGSVLYELGNDKRTDIAIAFMQEIYEKGYTPMFYGSSYAMTGSRHWDMDRIGQSYKVWVSQYPALPYPQTQQSSYEGFHAMWQYTNQGSVPGISQPVDVNVAYFGYEGAAEALDGQAPDQAQPDAEALMNFQEVDELVTAKESTNLRDIPSQGEDSTVLWTLQNGDSARRTGVSDSGWSRLIYQDRVCYAVTNLLTTNLSPNVPQPTPMPEEDGIKTQFTPCNELMTAKIETNLRALPSVTNPEAVVVATIRYGDVVVRTGVNTDLGWSRVEYEGQVLYCVSSYLTSEVESEQAQ